MFLTETKRNARSGSGLGNAGSSEKFIYNYTLIILGDDMELIVKPRQWGNSLGITLPKKVIEQEKISIGDELVIEVKKRKNVDELRKLFGTLKVAKSTQQIKDEMRKGWD